MATNIEQVETRSQVKRYKVQYPVSAYTLPQEALVHQVSFDDENMHIGLTDGRVLSIPLWWIPSLYDAELENREKFEITPGRTTIIWDPDKSGINDEVCIADYLGPHTDRNDGTPLPSK